MSTSSRPRARRTRQARRGAASTTLADYDPMPTPTGTVGPPAPPSPARPSAGSNPCKHRRRGHHVTAARTFTLPLPRAPRFVVFAGFPTRPARDATTALCCLSRPARRRTGVFAGSSCAATPIDAHLVRARTSFVETSASRAASSPLRAYLAARRRVPQPARTSSLTRHTHVHSRSRGPACIACGTARTPSTRHLPHRHRHAVHRSRHRHPHVAHAERTSPAPGRQLSPCPPSGAQPVQRAYHLPAAASHAHVPSLHRRLHSPSSRRTARSPLASAARATCGRRRRRLDHHLHSAPLLPVPHRRHQAHRHALVPRLAGAALAVLADPVVASASRAAPTWCAPTTCTGRAPPSLVTLRPVLLRVGGAEAHAPPLLQGDLHGAPSGEIIAMQRNHAGAGFATASGGHYAIYGLLPGAYTVYDSAPSRTTTHASVTLSRSSCLALPPAPGSARSPRPSRSAGTRPTA